MQQYLKKAEVAELLKVTTRTVDNLVRRGVLPVVHIGRVVRFPAEECDDAIQKYTSRGRLAVVRGHELTKITVQPKNIATGTTKGGKQ